MEDSTPKRPHFGPFPRNFAPYWPHFAPYWGGSPGPPGPFLRCAYDDGVAKYFHSY